MTDDELHAALAYWQHRLRLRDWHITAHFADGHSLAADDRGACVSLWKNKSAHIHIRRESRYPDTWYPSSPVDGEEEALVHELLHCTFAGFEADTDSPADDLQHQAICAIATALVEEHRRQLGD